MPPTLLVYGVCVCVCWVLECVTSIHLPSPNPLQGHWGAGAYPSSLGASGSGVDSSLAYHSHVERQTSEIERPSCLPPGIKLVVIIL